MKKNKTKLENSVKMRNYKLKKKSEKIVIERNKTYKVMKGNS